ncbi:EamA family transporter [Paucilactobacillus nenjiangensis]|uniref:EamA family transporter n=2 Tax=Paucilactobacillus nenjiangensis TaxID=1296540 RepID=A0A5P1WZJ7_9LACO|nr:EamA family transporter [Paucilactobacillus nenjiangensis]QER66663.1 EamA family transporter [Paucilactobacillus nenjiangensis]
MSNKRKGILLAIIGPIMWGISGNVAEYLFSVPNVTPQWLVTIRLFGSGILLLFWCLVTEPKKTMAVWKSPHTIINLLVFGLAGVLVSQYTYFSAVAETNAPTATIMQMSGTVFIIVYLALRSWQLPRRLDVISVIFAVAGTFFLITHGHLNSLAITPMGAIWGVLSGLGAAFYTLLPRKLLKEYDTKLAIGWAMLFAGIVMLPGSLSLATPKITVPVFAAIFYVTVFGTMLAYLFYVASLNYLSPATTGMLGVFEPLTATLIGVAFLGTRFGVPEIFGICLILATTFLQTIPTEKLARFSHKPTILK